MKFLQVVVLVMILAGFTQCKLVYYAPNMANTPLFKEKGELQATAALGTGEIVGGSQLQAGYSVTDHLGIMANYFSGGSGSGEKSGGGTLGEAAVGLFTEIEDNTVLEIYSGFGLGKVEHLHNGDVGTSINFSRYFIQPSVGYTTDNFAVSFGARINYMHWYRLKYTASQLNPELQNNKFFQLEPALTVRAGLEHIKLQAQLVASGSDPNLKQEEVMVYLGLMVSLDDVLVKKEKKSL